MSEHERTPPETWDWDTTDPTARAVVAYFSDDLMRAKIGKIDPQVIADQLTADDMIVTNFRGAEAIARSRAVLSASLFNPARAELLETVAGLAGYTHEDLDGLKDISLRIGTLPERTLNPTARQELELAALQLSSSAQRRMQIDE